MGCHKFVVVNTPKNEYVNEKISETQGAVYIYPFNSPL